MQRMTWSQFVSWQHYFQLEPFGEERADYRAGIVASMIANANRDTTRHPDSYQPTDFMPDYAGDRAAQPITKKSAWQTIKSKAAAYAKAGGFGPAPRKREQHSSKLPKPVKVNISRGSRGAIPANKPPQQ